MTVQALFIDPEGIYPKLLGPDNCWGLPNRDAREYDYECPVVAHPPCHLWVNMAAVNWKRYGKQRPAWYQGGTDGGCFLSAYLSVRRYGGVLEHPAGSWAWGPAYDIGRPPEPGRWWHHNFGSSERGEFREGWVCEVWQSAYGHKARKRTWLLYCGNQKPFELRWDRNPGTHQVGWFDRSKPTLGKREASATPIEFAQELIRLAEWSVQ